MEKFLKVLFIIFIVIVIYKYLELLKIIGPQAKIENYKSCKAEKNCWKESIDAFFECKLEDYTDGKIDIDWTLEEIKIKNEIQTIIDNNSREEITKYYFTSWTSCMVKISKENSSAQIDHQK